MTDAHAYGNMHWSILEYVQFVEQIAMALLPSIERKNKTPAEHQGIVSAICAICDKHSRSVSAEDAQIIDFTHGMTHKHRVASAEVLTAK